MIGTDEPFTITLDRLKDMLIQHLGEKIGFHSRPHNNRSDIVFSKTIR